MAEVLWRGRPSQWINASAFTAAIGCLILFTALNSSGALQTLFNLPLFHGHQPLVKTVIFTLPIAFMIWRWLQTRFHTYELTEEVFREHYGVLNRVSQELELYRVNDTMILKPFDLNLMGLGNLVMHTTDYSTPVVVIRAVPNTDELREALRSFVEQARQRRGVVEIGNR